MNSPCLTFGMKPANFIERLRDKTQIIEDFSADSPVDYVYVLTGVRGRGKSVFMSPFANELRAKTIGSSPTSAPITTSWKRRRQLMIDILVHDRNRKAMLEISWRPFLDAEDTAKNLNSIPPDNPTTP